MSRLKLVLLFIIAINTFLLGQSQTDILKEKVIDNIDWILISEDKYEIKHPSNWDVNKSGQMGTTFMLFSPLLNETDNFRENVNLIIQDLSGYDLNLDQYVELSEGQIKTMITKGKIILNERMDIGDKEYQKIIYTGIQGVFKLKFEQYYWVIENEAFVLTLTCKEDEFDNYQEIGEHILNSFEIK